MPQEQLIRVMEVMCFAGAGLGICLLILAKLVVKAITDLDRRLRRLEERSHDFAAQDAWDSEEAR
jgi:hypothetical protein